VAAYQHLSANKANADLMNETQRQFSYLLTMPISQYELIPVEQPCKNHSLFKENRL